MRALKPVNVVVLREGEHSVLQAELIDADGRGVPSAERLKNATLLATPALPFAMLKAVDLQRDGATDPLQKGRDPPLTLQKRELNRFLEGVKEYEAAQLKRAAQKEQEALQAEMDKGDELDESVVLAGDRLPSECLRSAFRVPFECRPVAFWLAF